MDKGCLFVLILTAERQHRESFFLNKGVCNEKWNENKEEEEGEIL